MTDRLLLLGADCPEVMEEVFLKVLGLGGRRVCGGRVRIPSVKASSV